MRKSKWKQIQVKLIVISFLIIAASLAVIAFRPVVKDIHQSFIHKRIQREYHEQRPLLEPDIDIVDEWLKKQK